MGRAVNYAVSLEIGSDGWCTLWIAELPGFFINAPSAQAALRRLPQAVTAYLQWLEARGELPDAPERILCAVVERHQVRARLRWGGYRALHNFERPPVTLDELKRYLLLMGLLRADTGRLLGILPERAMSWRRPGGRWTIAQHLRHIGTTELWYLDQLRLGRVTLLGRVPDPMDRMERVRSLVGWRLMRLSSEERARIVETNGEEWSIRKMLGRFLYHERYHLRSMARIARTHRVPVPAGLAGWARY